MVQPGCNVFVEIIQYIVLFYKKVLTNTRYCGKIKLYFKWIVRQSWCIVSQKYVDWMRNGFLQVYSARKRPFLLKQILLYKT